MAIAIFPAGFGSISGRIGNLVFRKHGDRTIVSHVPVQRHRELTDAQLAHRRRFREANVYSRSALANPAVRAFYADLAGKRSSNPHAVAVGDFLRPPVIHDIALSLYQGHPEDEIIVHATDDSEVVSVTVTIKDVVGKVVERGPARERCEAWVYDATVRAPIGQPLTIEVTAMDRPGNAVTRSTPWVPANVADGTAVPPAARPRRAKARRMPAALCRLIT
jgi:hypothetical protein